MAIMQLVDNIGNAVENHETTFGVYLDLSRAFDTIDHNNNILLHKLVVEHYGFRGIAYHWFQCYVGNRKQYVFITGLNLILKYSLQSSSRIDIRYITLYFKYQQYY